MNIANIGLDIDGCMNNFHEVLNNIIKRDFDPSITLEEFDMLKQINISNWEQCREFFNKYNPEINTTVEVIPGVPETITKLRQLGLRAIYITAREYNVAELTEAWIKKSKLSYDEIYYSAGNKVDVCKWKNIKIMVEDKPENVLALANNDIQVLMPIQPYNKDIKHSNVISVTNWNEIYKHILKFNLKI